ncbi:pyruvate kinase alpha/beta domain-containing protein [Bacillus cereus]|uniref:pyruvate kinase alpha/beta domain-containing protein n=1 Tax=Bacillus cereus TaxID=1396 RepID=UPI003BF70822
MVTDAIMLSGETAAGQYPVEAVTMMANICWYVLKNHYNMKICSKNVLKSSLQQLQMQLAKSVHIQHLLLDVAAIVAPTESGYTAKMISKYRPKISQS